MSHGDITLAGVTLTLDEWQALDEESQQLLLSFAAEAFDPDEGIEAALVRYNGQTIQLPAIIDLLTPRN